MAHSKTGLKIILILLIIMVITDGVVTNILIQKGIAFEANPFLVSIAGTHSLILLKSVGVLVVVVILWDIYRRSPRLSFWASSAFLLAYFCIVAWNSLLLVMGVSNGA